MTLFRKATSCLYPRSKSKGYPVGVGARLSRSIRRNVPKCLEWKLFARYISLTQYIPSQILFCANGTDAFKAHAQNYFVNRLRHMQAASSLGCANWTALGGLLSARLPE